MTYSDIVTATFISSSLTGAISYFVSRHYKKKDENSSRRSNIIIDKTILNEVALFDYFNQIFQQISVTQDDYISAAANINIIRKNNRIYIGDEIYYLCDEIANYLLEVSSDSAKINKMQEQKFIHRYKDAFDK